MTRRRTLTREKVIAAAMGLADRDGLEALSMRHLAQAVGVEPMSLYNHVRDKDDLLDALADRVAAEMAPVTPDAAAPADAPEATVTLAAAGTGWRPAIRSRYVSARSVLRRHPWAVPLLESRPAGPDRMAQHEALLATLRDAGFSLELAHRAFLLLDGHLYGSVLQEQAWPYRDAAEIQAVASTIAARLPGDRYPHLRELFLERVVQTGPADEGAFAFGLDLILDGLAQARARGPVTHETGRAAG